MTENIDDKNKAFTSLVKPFARVCCMLYSRSRIARREQTKFRNLVAHSYGFTLAETLIVLAVLGIVAAITIPPVVRQHMEAMGRTKIKKSMSVYDLAIQKMTVENDLKSDTELINWSNEVENCDNTVPYFKAQNRNGCTFKTSDGVWWNISDIMNPIIALSEQALNDAISNGIDGIKSFKLVASFDRASGAFRVDDLNYEKLKLQAQLALSNEEDQQDVEDNVEELGKLFGFINNNKKTEDNGEEACDDLCQITNGSKYGNMCQNPIPTDSYSGQCSNCSSCTYINQYNDVQKYNEDGTWIGQFGDCGNPSDISTCGYYMDLQTGLDYNNCSDVTNLSSCSLVYDDYGPNDNCSNGRDLTTCTSRSYYNWRTNEYFDVSGCSDAYNKVGCSTFYDGNNSYNGCTDAYNKVGCTQCSTYTGNGTDGWEDIDCP